MPKRIYRMSGKLYRPQPVDDDGEAQWASRRALKPGDTLQSAGFHSGVKGWQITASGNAEFCNVIVRGYIVTGGAAADVNAHGITISGVKISDGTVTADKLVAGTITAAQIAAGTITADRLNASVISAIVADVEALTAVSIEVGTTDKLWLNAGGDGSLAIGGTVEGSAPFRVSASGALIATNATITGAITATSGTISGDLTVTGSLRSAATGARWSLAAAGFKRYDAGGTQRSELLSDGSGWLGASNQFRWTAAGVVELNGAAILPASVSDGKLNIYNVPTISGLTVTDHSPTAAYVAWSAFSLTLNGTSYAIEAGNSNLKYLYWVKPNLTLTGSATCPAMAANLAMVLYNNAGVGIPSLMQNFIYADYISVANLAAINADMGSITAGTVTGATIRTAASGARIEMTSSLLAGYASDGTTKEFYLQSSDGKAYCGGGSVVLDSGGLKLAYSTTWVDACNISWVSGATIKAAIGTFEITGSSVLRAWNYYSAGVYAASFFSTTSTTAASEIRAVAAGGQASVTCSADALGAAVAITGTVSVNGSPLGLVIIADQTLGADATTIDFSSIPATFKHLLLECSLRADTAGINDQTPALRFNNDSGANYDCFWAVQLGTNSDAASLLGDATSASFGIIPASGAPANDFAAYTIRLVDYLSTAHNKQFHDEGAYRQGASGMVPAAGGGNWHNSTPAAVNRITFVLGGASKYKAGSRATLYGLG